VLLDMQLRGVLCNHGYICRNLIYQLVQISVPTNEEVRDGNLGRATGYPRSFRGFRHSL
jgi:hypothetical protein